MTDVRMRMFALIALVAVALYMPAHVAAEPIQANRSRVVQVNLDQLPKVSQYLDINSSSQGYGKNACGLVAAAAAVGGDNWVPVVDLIAHAAGADYGQETGIQPSKYVAALQKVFGPTKVMAFNNSTLESVYDELAAGNIVIVDMKVNGTAQAPSAIPTNYAHFARVLGIDMNTQQIYIENTLHGKAYWTVSFAQFSYVWEYPETTASEIPDAKNAEPVTRWMVVLDSSLVNDGDF